MNFVSLFSGQSTASVLIVISLVGVLGILIGKIKFGKIRLGIAGVLFTGLLAGHLGAQFNPQVLHYIKEFGLILFVYTIGIEIGPRFISSFRNNGVKLNILAATIVVLGFLITVAIKTIFNVDTAVAAGLLCGAVTNTPSLGAAQSLITEQFTNGSALAETTGMAYAIAYPFGIIGIILAMSLIRMLFRIKVDNEADKYRKNLKTKNSAHAINITITNPNLHNKNIDFVIKSLDKDFVFSRISRDGKFLLPETDLLVKTGDKLYGLASKDIYPKLELTVGKVEKTRKFVHQEPVSMRHILITNRKISGHTIEQINLSGQFPANITRVFRGDTEIIAKQNTLIEFGDTVRVIGDRHRMEEIAKFLGNSLDDLSHPNLIPLFVGIFLGILLGSIPIFIPGLPAPAKLGLAGGPLIIALLLGHKGRIGKFDFYMTPSANKFLRELGIVLFLACVGIGSGGHFWETLVNGGVKIMAMGAAITFLPLIITGIIARFLKINYLTICGLLSGSMTDPPALEFANSISPTQAQANAYAMVYPLTMFLRILLAQLFVLMFV